MRTKPLFLLLIALLLSTGAVSAVHHAEDHLDRQGALLCPLCMALAQQAAAALFLVLFFFPLLEVAPLPAFGPDVPRTSIHTVSRKIRAPPR